MEKILYFTAFVKHQSTKRTMATKMATKIGKKSNQRVIIVSIPNLEGKFSKYFLSFEWKKLIFDQIDELKKNRFMEKNLSTYLHLKKSQCEIFFGLLHQLFTNFESRIVTRASRIWNLSNFPVDNCPKHCLKRRFWGWFLDTFQSYVNSVRFRIEVASI